MNLAKDIFLNAAKQGQACHINVHIEKNLMNMLCFMETARRAFGQSRTIAKALSANTPSLMTGLGSPPLIPPGDLDQVDIFDSYSAITSPKHSSFISENNTNVALISGIAATKCVQETKKDCLSRGITPIMIMDATDLAVYGDETTPENYNEFKEMAEIIWGDDVLTASTAEVCEWVQEL